MTEIQEKMKIQPQCVQEILGKSMPSSIWKELPLDVLENVLACLPVHVLCRFRLVCKKWKHLISQSSFAMLCALSPYKASSIVISPKFDCKKITTSTKWHVLDPREKRSYKLSDSFIIDSYLSSNKNRELRNTYWQKNTLAANKELIYIMYISSTIEMHIVCNPISKIFHEIPKLAKSLCVCNSDIVVMSVDSVTKTYKIVMYTMTIEPIQKAFFLYESTTSVWRKLCEAPHIGLRAYSSIFVKGIFYTLFLKLSSIPTCSRIYTIVLYKCDLVTGAWCKMDVDFPLLSTVEEVLRLVVSSGQLYIVKFSKCTAQMAKLSIWKIVLETKELVKVAKIQNFANPSHRNKMVTYFDMPVAIGCADSIIILCKEGRCLKFDLLEKHWQELPDHTLGNKKKFWPLSIGLVDF